jgi:hypothetical protein
MEGPRHIWWKLVSSRKEGIEQAQGRLAMGSFGSIPRQTEFIPLPGGMKTRVPRVQ